MSSSRPIVASSVMVSSWAGAVVGAHIADVVQAQHYNDPEWANLDPAFMILVGALFARAAFELGRWFVAVRTGMYLVPAGWAGFFVYARALVRVAAAAIGLRLGFEAGWWTAFFWDQWGSTAQFAGEAHGQFSNVWIITGSLWGGALGLLGFEVGRRFPAGVAFLAAYLALDAVRYVAPRIADLYWGTYTSSDQVAFVSWVSGLISVAILVPCFAAVAYWSARSFKVACTVAGFAAGAALGAWIGFEIQAFYYNDLEWRVMEEVLFFFLGGLGALAGRELGRWVAELRAGSRPMPSPRDWTKLLSGSLLRITLAAVGLWLGVEIGYWLALLWDEYASAAPFAYEAIALGWIASGCAIGGALALLGYRFGDRPPVAVALLGALLAFAIAPHLAPMQEHLYWGPFPSSDVHAGLWRRSLLVTGALATASSLVGYVSAGRLSSVVP